MTSGTHEVENLPLDYQVMKSVHHLLNAGRVIPPMDVENVDVVRTKLLQGRVNREGHRLQVVAGIVNLLAE